MCTTKDEAIRELTATIKSAAASSSKLQVETNRLLFLLVKTLDREPEPEEPTATPETLSRL